MATLAEERAAQRTYKHLQCKQTQCWWVTFLENANGDEVWDVLWCTKACMTSAIGMIANERGEHAEEDQDKQCMMAEVSFPVPNPYHGPQYQPGPPGKAYTRVDHDIIHAALYQQHNKKALAKDSISIPIIKIVLQWDPSRVMALVSQCLCLGYHPEEWKVAKGICIPKPGKKTYNQAKCYWVISLLSCLGKLIEKVATILITNDIEFHHILHEG
jgi:hypothetical protein